MSAAAFTQSCGVASAMARCSSGVRSKRVIRVPCGCESIVADQLANHASWARSDASSSRLSAVTRST
jgi:hypothetical protein